MLNEVQEEINNILSYYNSKDTDIISIKISKYYNGDSYRGIDYNKSMKVKMKFWGNRNNDYEFNRSLVISTFVVCYGIRGFEEAKMKHRILVERIKLKKSGKLFEG